MKLSISRAHVLKSLAMIPAAAVGLVTTLASPANAADNKKQFKYQDKPGPHGQTCAGCRFFKKPNGCTIVQGKISPKGWCVAWAK